MTTNHQHDGQHEHGIRREDLRGTWGMERLSELSGEKAKERAEQAKLYGLEAAPSIVDRSLTLFRREPWSLGGGSTFMQAPFLQDMRQPGGQDVVVVGVPLDTGTTYRSGTRFGPEAVRRVSSPGYGYFLQCGNLYVYRPIRTGKCNTFILPVNNVDCAGDLLRGVARGNRGKLAIFADAN